jgi:DNA replication protein DnaC
MTETKRVGDLIGNLEELPVQEYQCSKHGKYEGRPYTMKLGRLGIDKIFDAACPACEKEGKEREEKREAEHLKRQREIANEERIARLKEMNIGKKFWDEDFTTFNPYTPELQHFFNICTAFTSDPGGRMLVMLGNHGNGKNHLAAAALKKLGGYMYSVFEMELLIRKTYKSTTTTNEWDFYNRLCNAPLLVINEIGKHKLGDWEQFFMSYIINKRYENMMPIILISNTHLKENCPDGGNCEMCFERYLGDDVISRIIECGESMTFTGEDYRNRLRGKRREE